MQVIRGINTFKGFEKPTVVTIGNFDGIHLGHKALIEQVLDLSQKKNALSIIMTFDPHPLKILRPELQIKRIFPVEEQIEIIKQLKVDALIIEPFTLELSQVNPEDFVQKWLVLPLNLKTLIVGHDFKFGKNRSGDLNTLKDLSKKYHFEIIEFSPLKLKDEIVSSSLIRKYIEAGNVTKAFEFLNRPFYLKGKVIQGDHRGTKIGFPTANLQTNFELIPQNGVYITKTTLLNKSLNDTNNPSIDQSESNEIGGTYQSVVNIGLRPTFNKTENLRLQNQPHQNTFFQIESHILNFSKDIYNQNLKIEFYKKLRDEMKFNSVDNLKKQIEVDIQNTRLFFKEKNL